MDKNPLEQQRAEINALRDKMKDELGCFFDEKEKFDERIKDFVLRLESYEKGGLVFNKEEIIRGVKESVGIQDRETFVASLLKIMEPLITLKAAHSKIFEKIQRDEVINNSNYLRLSEVLYAGFENEAAHIHLAPATELIKEEGIGNFKKEIEKGLIKLAEIIKSDDKIKEIWAISWIVAKNPFLLKRLGFIIVGEISEEERKEDFFDEKRPVAKAFIKREDFLAKYGDKQSVQY